MNASTLEHEIQGLLDATRESAFRFGSAHYRKPGATGRDGLAERLETIEVALIRLARAIDNFDA
jgi:hypothetical protein